MGRPLLDAEYLSGSGAYGEPLIPMDEDLLIARLSLKSTNQKAEINDDDWAVCLVILLVLYMLLYLDTTRHSTSTQTWLPYRLPWRLEE